MEPKQEYKYIYIGECKGNNDNGCFMESPGYDCGCYKRVQQEEPKQLTDREEYQSVKDFSRGAKWQARRMYNEEEVLNILYKHTEDLLAGKKITLEQWFEQYKKK
jgi:hypothetical protein